MQITQKFLSARSHGATATGIGSTIMGAGDTCSTKWVQDPLTSDWICENPLSQLAHHSRIKGHLWPFLTQFAVAPCERALTTISIDTQSLVWPGFYNEIQFISFRHWTMLFTALLIILSKDLWYNHYGTYFYKWKLHSKHSSSTFTYFSPWKRTYIHVLYFQVKYACVNNSRSIPVSKDRNHHRNHLMK